MAHTQIMACNFLTSGGMVRAPRTPHKVLSMRRMEANKGE